MNKEISWHFPLDTIDWGSMEVSYLHQMSGCNKSITILQCDEPHQAPSSNRPQAPSQQSFIPGAHPNSCVQAPHMPEHDRNEFSANSHFQGPPENYLTSPMVEVIVKAFEAAVCNILGQNNPFQLERQVKDQEVKLEKSTEPSNHWDFILVSQTLTSCLFHHWSATEWGLTVVQEEVQHYSGCRLYRKRTSPGSRHWCFRAWRWPWTWPQPLGLRFEAQLCLPLE